MIRLYVASTELTKKDQDIQVRLVLPKEDDNDIFAALQKTGMETVDDCEVSELECDIEEVHDFLNELFVDKLNVFDLNDLAKMLESYDHVKIKKLCAEIREGRFHDLDALKNWHYTEDENEDL